MVARGWGREEWGVLFNSACLTLVWEYENVLETDSGKSCTKTWMFLMPLNCTFKKDSNGNFCVTYIVPHYKTKREKTRWWPLQEERKERARKGCNCTKGEYQVLRQLHLFSTLPMSSLPIYTYIHCLYMPASSATTYVCYVPYFTGSKAHILKNLISLKLKYISQST